MTVLLRNSESEISRVAAKSSVSRSNYQFWPRNSAWCGSGPFLCPEGVGVSFRVLCCVRKSVARIEVEVARAVRWWRSSVWPRHLHRVATDPVYAAAASAVLAGAFGLLPAREVVAAVLTVIIGALLRQRLGGQDAGTGLIAAQDVD